MRPSTSRPTLLFRLLCIAFGLSSVSAHSNSPSIHKQHHDLARRLAGDSKLSGDIAVSGSRRRSSSLVVRGADSIRHTLAKRAPSSGSFEGRATFYAVGLGACGWTNSDSEYVVALNGGQYGQGGWCGQTITITYGGKSHNARIVDMCPGCPHGALDLSPSLFNYFSDPDAGVFYMEWTVGGGGGGDGGGQQTSSARPTSSYTPTSSAMPTSSTLSSSSSAVSSSSASSSAASASASVRVAGATVGTQAEPQGVLGDLSSIVIGIGAIISHAGGALNEST